MHSEFFICGGELRINKKIFVREMLRPASIMKQLLNYNLEEQNKSRYIEIDKSSADTVIISFTQADQVSVGDDYQNLLADLKKEYRGAVRGYVSMTAHSFEFDNMHINLNLNHEEKLKLEL